MFALGRRALTCAALVATLVVLAGCGASSPAQSSNGAAQANENARHINAYARALEGIIAPFRHFPMHPGDSAEATRLLGNATRRLAALSVPVPFQASHDKLLSGMRAQLALVPKQHEAARAGDQQAVAMLRVEDLSEQASIRAALAETSRELSQCRADKFFYDAVC